MESLLWRRSGYVKMLRTAATDSRHSNVRKCVSTPELPTSWQKLVIKTYFQKTWKSRGSPQGQKKKFIMNQYLKGTQNNPGNSGSEILSSPDIAWILLALGLMEVHSLKCVLPKMTVLVNTKIK